MIVAVIPLSATTDIDFSFDEGEQIAWNAIEAYWDAVDIYASPKKFLTQFLSVPEHIGHLLAVWWCNSEVCNGGFHQFFKNPTGILAPEALDGYRAIGLVECSEIVERVIQMFDVPYPRERELRHTKLATLEMDGETRKEWDPFYATDPIYYATKNRENISQAMGRYAESAG